MKTIVKAALLIAAVLVIGYLVDRLYQADAALAVAKSEYNALKAETETAQAASQAAIADLNDKVIAQNTAILALKADVAVKQLQLVEAKKAYADLVASEPSQPELETEPLVINLRAQVAELREMVDLGLEVVQTQAAEIETLELQANTLNALAAEWQASYEREHALRVQSEALFEIGEHRRKANKLYAYAGAALALAAGYFIGH